TSNTFREASPPNQGFFILSDKTYSDWWANQKGGAPIPNGHICRSTPKPCVSERSIRTPFFEKLGSRQQTMNPACIPELLVEIVSSSSDRLMTSLPRAPMSTQPTYFLAR
ncbi:hypothetical protein ACHAWF_007153, partial [Thalassiosira exigua]